MDEDGDDETEIHNINLINSILESENSALDSSRCPETNISTATEPSSILPLPTVSSIQIALALNKLTDKKLMRLETLLISHLSECKQELQAVQAKNHKETVKSKSFQYINCGKPYFRDKNNIQPPKNNDTTLMKNTPFYDFTDVKSVNCWTVKEKKSFIEVILELSRDIWEKKLHSSISQYQRVATSGDNNEDSEMNIEVIRKEIDVVKKMSLSELALPIDEEYDWDEVSARLHYRRSPSEYRSLWKLLLHPSLSKAPWTHQEHLNLKAIGTKHKFQDWDEIAKELGTGRSGYQCFVYYRANFSNKLTAAKWTTEEEEYLKRLVQYYKQDNGYIPWEKIMLMISNKTKLQIYNKYLSMKEKKGRFLPEEDAVLLTCVNKYGTNFKKISNFLIGRSVKQIRQRYQLISKSNKTSCVWNVAEDKLLLQLMANRGTGNYADIIEIFPGKDRINIRTRHVTLLQWMKLHPTEDISNAPRRRARRLVHGQAANDLADTLDALKTKITAQYQANISSKVCVESSEKEIEHSITVTMMNEMFWKCDQTTDGDVTCIDSDGFNLQKVLILLGAKLNKSKLESNSSANSALLDNKPKLLQSYSRKKTTSVVRADKEPDVWGVNTLTNTTSVLPPHLATLNGCNQLIKYSKHKILEKKILNRIQVLKQENNVFAKQYDKCVQRFKCLFLWPMLVSKMQPKNLVFNRVRSLKADKYGVALPDTVSTIRFKKLKSKADVNSC